MHEWWKPSFTCIDCIYVSKEYILFCTFDNNHEKTTKTNWCPKGKQRGIVYTSNKFEHLKDKLSKEELISIENRKINRKLNLEHRLLKTKQQKPEMTKCTDCKNIKRRGGNCFCGLSNKRVKMNDSCEKFKSNYKERIAPLRKLGI